MGEVGVKPRLSNDNRHTLCYIFQMKRINWNAEKNQILISERGISFEDVLFSIQMGKLLDDMTHPNQAKYPNQRILIIEKDDYAYLVPYVESEHDIFLKTIIPSRKATKQYLGGRNDES